MDKLPNPKSRVIAVANAKGGVGKTTSVANLASALVERARVVLSVDLDPQASLTVSLGFHPAQLPRTIRHALDEKGIPIDSIVLKTRENFDLLPGDPQLERTARELEKTSTPIYAVRAALEPVRDHYDYVLIDCPASAGDLTRAALAAADEVIIPVTMDYLGFKAIEWLLAAIQELQQTVNPGLMVGGIFYSMFDSRTRHARETISRLQSTFGSEFPFFSTVIGQSVRLKEASSAGKTVLRYAPDSSPARAYRSLAQEIDEGIRESTENELYFALTRGKEALLQQDLTSAYAAFCRATSIDPGSADAWAGRSESAPEWAESVRCSTRALKLAPSLKASRVHLAKVLNEEIYSATQSEIPELIKAAHHLSEMDQDAFAEKVYECVTELDPAHEEAWLGRARTTPDSGAAIAYIKRCLEINPNNVSAQEALVGAKEHLKAEASRLVDEGLALERAANRAEALARYLRAVELDPRNELGWLGCAHTTDDESAIPGLARKVLEINPLNEEARDLIKLFWWLSEAPPHAEPLQIQTPSWTHWVYALVAIAAILFLIYVVITLIRV